MLCKARSTKIAGLATLLMLAAGSASAQFLSDGQITKAGIIPELTYSTLVARNPCSSTTKIVAIVTDAPTPVQWGQVVSQGGGTGRALVASDGTNWVTH